MNNILASNVLDIQVAVAKRRNRNACIERLQRYLVGLEKKMEAQRCHGQRALGCWLWFQGFVRPQVDSLPYCIFIFLKRLVPLTFNFSDWNPVAGGRSVSEWFMSRLIWHSNFVGAIVLIEADTSHLLDYVR